MNVIFEELIRLLPEFEFDYARWPARLINKQEPVDVINSAGPPHIRMFLVDSGLYAEVYTSGIRDTSERQVFVLADPEFDVEKVVAWVRSTQHYRLDKQRLFGSKVEGITRIRKIK